MATRPGSRTQLASVGASCIKSTDLARIRALASGSSTTGASGRHFDRDAAARRKARMIALDEQRLKEKAESGEADVDAQRALEAKLAPFMEQHDIAKTMRSRAAQAEALNGRRAQIAEKKRKEAAEREEERRFHAESMRRLEEERLAEATAKRTASVRRRVAADELRKQLEAREMDRILDRERSALEGEAIKRSIALQEEAELRKVQARRMKAKDTMAAMKVQNAEQAKRRGVQARLDHEENLRMMEYQSRKAAEERALEERTKREKHERDMLHAKMLAEQEKVMDTRGAEDEARAVKHEEARIMADRAAERAKVEARKKRLVEIAASQQQQRLLKERERAREKVIEAEQVARFQRDLAEASAADARASRAKREAARRNQEDVLSQVEARKLLTKEAEKEILYERKAQKMLRKAEANLMSKYKEDMLYKLGTKRHVEPEFLRDVSHMKVDV